MTLWSAFFFFQAEDGIRDLTVTGVQTCALPIWLLVRLEIAARTHDRRPVVLGYAERDHVPFDEFSEMNTGVEAQGDEVDSGFIGRHVEHHVRVIARKLSQLWGEHRRPGNGRHY